MNIIDYIFNNYFTVKNNSNSTHRYNSIPQKSVLCTHLSFCVRDVCPCFLVDIKLRESKVNKVNHVCLHADAKSDVRRLDVAVDEAAAVQRLCVDVWWAETQMRI